MSDKLEYVNVKPAEGFYGGHSSQPFTNHDVPPELMDELIANLYRMSGDDINLATPENSGTDIISTSLLLYHLSSS